MQFRAAYIIGTDLAGRACRAACVQVPAHLNYEQTLKYVRSIVTDPVMMTKPYAATQEIQFR